MWFIYVFIYLLLNYLSIYSENTFKTVATTPEDVYPTEYKNNCEIKQIKQGTR